MRRRGVPIEEAVSNAEACGVGPVSVIGPTPSDARAVFDMGNQTACPMV